VVLVHDSTSANLRWANNTLTTNGVMRGVDVTVIAFARQSGGVCVGSVSGTAGSVEQVDDLVTAADAAARAASPAADAHDLVEGTADTAWDDEPGETDIHAFDVFAPALGEAFGRARHGGRILYGFVDHHVTTTYVGSTNGMRLRHVQPTGHYACTGKTTDLTNSAWVGGATRDFVGVDALAIEAAEAAVHCNYPQGAGAVLIVELDGPAVEVEAQFAEVESHCRTNGAFEIRIATDDAERALFWKGRKSAFAAVGRISPDYIVQDGVIPRTALPEVLRRIAELSSSSGVRVANVFHAGDGNLHPLVLFDESLPGQAEDAEKLSGAILDLCIEYGGSITGEHGIGMDKAKYMSRMFTDADLDTMQLLRCAFDPEHLSNPGKIFPTPRLCGEVPGRHKGAHPLQESGLAEVF